MKALQHPVAWAAPQPFWRPGPATASARAALAQPQILRFANDEFIEELLATLQSDPAALPNYTAQPETWRAPHAGPAPAPEQWVERHPARLLPLIRKAKARQAPPVVPAPVLRAVRSIEGGLEEDEAELLALTALDVLARPGRPRRLLEIGSYCGKATCVLAHAVRLCTSATPGALVLAVDTFDGVIGSLDTGLQRKGDTRARFDAMLAQQGLGGLVDVHVGRAATLALRDEIDLLLIDGLHDYASVATDFHAVASHLASDALVAFHDCAAYFPGVCTLVAELIGSGAWQERSRAGSLCVLERVMEPVLEPVMESLPTLGAGQPAQPGASHPACTQGAAACRAAA